MDINQELINSVIRQRNAAQNAVAQLESQLIIAIQRIKELEEKYESQISEELKEEDEVDAPSESGHSSGDI